MVKYVCVKYFLIFTIVVKLEVRFVLKAMLFLWCINI